MGPRRLRTHLRLRQETFGSSPSASESSAGDVLVSSPSASETPIGDALASSPCASGGPPIASLSFHPPAHTLLSLPSKDRRVDVQFLPEGGRTAPPPVSSSAHTRGTTAEFVHASQFELLMSQFAAMQEQPSQLTERVVPPAGGTVPFRRSTQHNIPLNNTPPAPPHLQ